MDKKHISNPLTIIGVFCSISEISGTIILLNVSGIVQYIFLGFVIGFPVAILILFFTTLNSKNYHRLYSPTDYDDSDTFRGIWEKAYDIVQKDPEKADAYFELVSDFFKSQGRLRQEFNPDMLPDP